MYVRVGKLLSRSMCLFSSHQVRNRRSQIDPIVPTLPPTRRACATHLYAQYCCGSLCLSEPAVLISLSALPDFFFILFHVQTQAGVPVSLPLFLLLLLRIPVCDPAMLLLQLCSAQCANSRSRQHTMCIRQMRAAL